jgi:putative hydrolase of the HAD superfamily
VNIKAVGFDLDGTLYPAWLMYAVSADIGIRHPRLLHAFSRVRKLLRKPGIVGALAQDAALARQTQTASETFKIQQASLVAKSLGADPVITAQSIDNIVYSAIEKRFSRVKPCPGVTSCLGALRHSGLRLGLLSDLPPAKKIKLLGFEDYFDLVLCSEDFGALKPDPRPFSALSAGLSVEPESILYVGNKREYDIAGAKSIGMKTAFIGRGKDPDADFSFTKWENLTRWILDRKS